MDISRARRNCDSGKDYRNFKTCTELSRSIQNLKSVGFLAFFILLVGYVGMAEAQQPKKVPRIGYVSGSGDPSNPGGLSFDAFRQGLRDRGYIEGKNILVEHRYAEGNMDLIPTLVGELVQLKVDVLVATNFPAIRAAKQATKTIPIVMVATVDPVATGMVDSLARPGGNITGLTRLTQELSGKRLELLKEVLPRMSRIGVLWDANSSSAAIAFKEYEAVARVLKVQLQSLEVQYPSPNFEGAFQSAIKGRASALITVRSSLFNRYPKQIAGLAIKTDFLRCPKEVTTSRPGALYLMQPTMLRITGAPLFT